MVSILIVVLVVALAGCPLFPGGDDTDDTGAEQQEEQEEQDDGTGDDAEPTDGTVTVSLSGAAAADDEYLVAYAYDAGSRVAADYPSVAIIDGAQTVSVAYGDMAVNFFAADLYSATDHAGEDFVVGVFPRDADPTLESDPMLGIAICTVAPAPNGWAFVVVQDVDGGVWEGTTDEEYDVYMFIDLDSNERPGTGDWHYNRDTPADPQDPYQYTQSENEYVATDYEDGDYSLLD